MVEKTSLEFSLRNIDETRNYFLDEISHNGCINEKYKKNYLEHLLILVSTFTNCVSFSAIVSLVAIHVGITIFAVGIKNCGITAGIKKQKSIIKKKKKKHDKIVLLEKVKLNIIEALM